MIAASRSRIVSVRLLALPASACESDGGDGGMSGTLRCCASSAA